MKQFVFFFLISNKYNEANLITNELSFDLASKTLRMGCSSTFTRFAGEFA